MNKKRYVLEEVLYDNCRIKYIIPHKKVKCMPFQCEKCGMFGDTKEQITNKMAQVLLKDYLKAFKGAKIDKASINKIWQMQKKLATEIFDFMWKEKGI